MQNKPTEEQSQNSKRFWLCLNASGDHEKCSKLITVDIQPEKCIAKFVLLLKVSTLNDFYSTNIFSVFPVAKHILSLGIDARLKAGDVTLVNDIKQITINGAERNFYSFASKYCSHHNPLDYPIYDSYVDTVLRFFRKRDGFASFSDGALKDYVHFKGALIDFRVFYGLEEYNLKQLDKYLWLLGKDCFPKEYGKKG